MNLTFKWPQLDQIDPIFIQNDRIPIENCFFMAFKSKSSLRTMAEDTSLSWEGYLERKESIGSTENDQIIIPIMWFKQTARMQWSFYKKMLLSGNVQFYTIVGSRSDITQVPLQHSIKGCSLMCFKTWDLFMNDFKAIIPLKILLNSNLILYIVSLLIIFFTVPFISKRTSSQYQPLSEVDPSSEDSEAPEELPGLESSIPEENWAGGNWTNQKFKCRNSKFYTDSTLFKNSE